MQPFTPQFLLESELQTYDLPTTDSVPNILNVVQFASSLVDESCGRLDGDGNGSLAYTTYTSRILMQGRNRNLIQLPMKPVVGVSADTVATLQTAGAGSINYTYTGVQANTITAYTGGLSGIVAASGRYGYVRQDMAVGYPDLWATINPLNLVTMFGGPAPFVAIDISNTDYDSRTGEVWIPVGYQLQRYSEVIVIYNSGYNPLQMPGLVKQATAAATKNLLAKGGGTTGVMGLSLGKSGMNVRMQDSVIDPNIYQLLTPFRNTRAY